jgi:hypothetical protein
MAVKIAIAALGFIATAAPLAAAHLPDPPVAPAGTEATRYCMKIEITGSRIEEVKCWTRREWAEQEVDVDKEWAEEGVRVIG